MNELLKINYEADRITLSARELHGFLEIGTEFAKWMQRMVEYGFEENVDYRVFVKNDDNPKGGRPSTDYEISLDMAKEIAMIQRNEKGKLARQYFIQIEKEWNTPEKVMARGLIVANQQIEQLALENKMKDQVIAELKPRADYCDIILNNKGLSTINAIAKDYGMSGTSMNKKLHQLGVQYKQGNQWLLYSKYQNMGYTQSQTINIERHDGRPDVTMHTKWTQKGRLFLYNLLKDNGVLPMIERT